MHKLSELYNLKDLRVFYINGFTPVLIDISADDMPFIGFEHYMSRLYTYDAFITGNNNEDYYFIENDIKPLELLTDLTELKDVSAIVTAEQTLLRMNNLFYPVYGVTDNPDEIFNYIEVGKVKFFFNLEDVYTTFE